MFANIKYEVSVNIIHRTQLINSDFLKIITSSIFQKYKKKNSF